MLVEPPTFLDAYECFLVPPFFFSEIFPDAMSNPIPAAAESQE